MPYQTFDIKGSITKKQTVAVTGLLLILFVIAHLAGNLFIYGGPRVFNGYAQKLEHFGILLKIAEWGLALIFLIHIERVSSLIVQNIRAKGGLSRYALDNSRGPRSLATRLMPYSGTYLLIYLIWHLYDFAWANPEGPRSYIHGMSYGLYGLVVNSFKDPLHSWLYVLAMVFLGLHLAHGTESFIQTFAFNDFHVTKGIKRFSHIFAGVMVLAYSSIPLYVLYILPIR